MTTVKAAAASTVSAQDGGVGRIGDTTRTITVSAGDAATSGSFCLDGGAAVGLSQATICRKRTRCPELNKP
jgi:hypothetical protein